MLKLITTITEVLMVLYWILAAALVLNLVRIDPSLMYSDHQNPLVVAWNWSFFPIDIAFAGMGLFAKYGNVSGGRKFKLEISAATLMICAGLMAISYWVITGDFNLTWWVVNIWLVVLGLINLFSATADESRP
jgi:succinate dehydrogenase hydrophobic anchor subunit